MGILHLLVRVRVKGGSLASVILCKIVQLMLLWCGWYQLVRASVCVKLEVGTSCKEWI